MPGRQLDLSDKLGGGFEQLTMLQALDLMDEILYIISTILVAFHAVEVVDIVSSLVLVLFHRLHGREALVATFEGTWYLIGRSSHSPGVTVGP